MLKTAVIVLLLILFGVPAFGQTWVTAWGRVPISTTITTDHTFKDPAPSLGGKTLRVMSCLTTSGTQVRIKLSQRFSSVALRVTAVHIAVRGTGSSIVAGTDRAVTFSGSQSVSVPAGGEVWSDPVSLSVTAHHDLATSLYVPGGWVPTTEGARGGLKTSYYKSGNVVSASNLQFASTTKQVFGVFEVQVSSPAPAMLIACLGNSITEGACSNLDANGDWPDLLSNRLTTLPDGTRVGVLNAGVGSGRFASSDGAGVRGLMRIPDLLVEPSLKWVVILMGVNDISYEHSTANALIQAYASAISQIHAMPNVRVVGVPILPFGRSSKDVGGNVQVALDVNAWIRAHDKRNGAAEPSYDAVIDFEPVVKDPNDSRWALMPSLTCDRVHPNQAGYTAMANAIDLSLFQTPPALRADAPVEPAVVRESVVESKSGIVAIVPNPSAGAVTVRFAVARADWTRLAIYDVAGRRMWSLVDAPSSAGVHEARWDGRTSDGRGVKSGMYFARLDVGGTVQTKPLMIVR